MASVSSKTDQLVDVKSEENKEVDATKRSDGEENTVKYSAADVTEENPEEESEDFSIVEEGIETSREIEESETVEKIDVDSSSTTTTTIAAYVKDLEDETGIPEEQKKEISDALVPDLSLAAENDDPNAPTRTEVSAYDLEVQAEEQQIRETETQEPSSNEADKGSGYAEAVQKKEDSLEEEIPANPVEPLETKTEVALSYTDLSAAEVSPVDQGRASETAEFVERENDVRFEIEKEAIIIDASAKDHNIVPEASDVPSKDKKVSSSSDERKSERLEDVDTTLVKAPKDLNTVEASPEQVIEENKNENSNDIEIPKSTAEVLKEIGSTEMIEKKKNDSEDCSMLEKNVQIPDDTKEETQLEGIQTAADKSEKTKLGAEKEETHQKSKDADPIVSSDTADTKLIKESTKGESKNFFSKAKRSIVKAKKAILGKSPGPKTVSSEIKDEIS